MDEKFARESVRDFRSQIAHGLDKASSRHKFLSAFKRLSLSIDCFENDDL